MRTAFKCLVWAATTVLFVTAAAAAPACSLSAADKDANARLSYDDFDQKGALPSSFRMLSIAGCHREAADAAEDYMLHHPGLNEVQRSNVLFHEGQARAMAGDERTAAMLIAATLDLHQKPDEPFDWNTYVEGTWAFLVKDRNRLEEAAAKLGRPGNEDNAINVRVLRNLLACYDRPYKEAYGSKMCVRR